METSYSDENLSNRLFKEGWFGSIIQDLNVQELLQIVTFINKRLRDKVDNEGIVQYNDLETAGDLVAPTLDIRETILENMLTTLKQLTDVKLRAELVYYTFIDLHMFSDGNGRTSRLLYGLVADKIENQIWYYHNEDDESEYHGDFSTYKGFKNEIDMNAEMNSRLSTVIEKYKENHPILANKEIFDVVLSANITIREPIDNLIPPQILNQLTLEEKKKINIILNDFSGNYSIGGLTMLIITSENNQLEEWVKRDNDNVETFLSDKSHSDYEWLRTRVCFDFNKNGDLLGSWTLEDWKKVIEVGNKLKCMQFEQLNQYYIEKQNEKRK